MSVLDVAAPPSPLAVPGQRGRTTIADRVVARIATRAVAEVGQTGGAARQLIGLTLGRQTGERPARVSARVNGNLAMIEMRLSLAYPAPVRGLTREVRRHVTERVTTLTGIEVRHVDVEVARLLPGDRTVNDIARRAGDTAVLVPDGERPLPARADAWSLPGPRRKARREFRPRRRIPGVLVAAVLVAAGVVGCIWTASAALGHPLWNVPHSDFAGPLQSTVHWDDTGTLLAASAVALVGFLLIAIAGIPGRTRAIPLASGDDSLVIGVPRRSLHRSLGWLATGVAGIDKAKVRTGRHSVKVRATTRLRDPAGLREGVQAVVEDRLARLDPLWPLRVKVRLRRMKG